MKIKVKNLLPNRFRNIDAYPINQEKIRQLRNSIRETTFWNNILARPAPGNGKFEIAYGHHRLIAIKEELGEDTVVDIPVRDLSDEDMLRIMANENMQEWATDWRVIVETVRAAKKFLEEHPEIIEKMGIKNYPVIGAIPISEFLGRNWKKTRVMNALAVMKDKEIQDLTFKSQIEKTTDMKSLERISSIQDIGAKKQWLNKIPLLKVRKEDITQAEIIEIARFENEPTLSNHDKEIVRKNILEGRIRGKEQIRDQVEFIKVRKLQEAKKSDEEKRREDLGDFINKIDASAVNLKNKIEVLVAQFKEHPDTKKYLPQEETQKLARSLTTLFVVIRQLLDITKSRKEERKERLSATSKRKS
ncbi:hypothetical protein ES703_22554 [subsurface metagenome]